RNKHLAALAPRTAAFEIQMDSMTALPMLAIPRQQASQRYQSPRLRIGNPTFSALLQGRRHGREKVQSGRLLNVVHRREKIRQALVTTHRLWDAESQHLRLSLFAPT